MRLLTFLRSGVGGTLITISHLYINSHSPTHRFFENKFRILGRVHFGDGTPVTKIKGRNF